MEMNYDAFVERTRHLALFGHTVFTAIGATTGSPSLQLNRWVKKGKVIRLKRGLYTLPGDRRQAPLSPRWVANALYSPSYLSLEFILSAHDLIPERVEAITSVTRLKTARFINPLGRFVYHHVKEVLFFGFHEVADEYGVRVLAAAPEKALLDTLYLRNNWDADAACFETVLRLQQLDQLSRKRLKEYVVPYQSRKLSAAVQVLLRMMEAP